MPNVLIKKKSVLYCIITVCIISATQEGVLSEEEIKARNTQENLEGTKQKLKQLEQEISLEKQEDQNLEGVEGIIQRLITVSVGIVFVSFLFSCIFQSAREVLNTVNGQTDIFWSKVKQMEVEVYKVNNVLADTTGELKDVLKDLFSTLNKVCYSFKKTHQEIFWS